MKHYQNEKALEENKEIIPINDDKECISDLSGLKKEAAFSKSQLLKSKKFLNRKDILTALLEENKEYTLNQAEEIITNFMKGQVK